MELRRSSDSFSVTLFFYDVYFLNLSDLNIVCRLSNIQCIIVQIKCFTNNFGNCFCKKGGWRALA